MNGIHNAQSTDLADLGRHIVCRCLPILGAGVLIFWLSGGLTPRAWLSFFQTCVHFHALWAERGAALLLLLFIQLVQSLLLAGAWGVLGWMAVSEGSVLYDMVSDAKQAFAPALASPPSSKASLPQLPQGRSATAQQQKMLRISQIARTPIQQSRGNTAAPLSPMRDDGMSKGMQMLPPEAKRLWAYDDENLKNPFDDWEASPPTQNARPATNPFNDWEAFPPAQSARPAQRNYQAQSNNSEGRLGRLPSHQQEVMGEYPLFDEAAPSLSAVQQNEMMNPFFIDEKRLAALRQKEAAINQPDLEDKEQSGFDIPQPGTGSMYPVQGLEQSSPEHESGDFSSILDQMGFLPRQQSQAQPQLDEAQMLQQQAPLKVMAQNRAEVGERASLNLKKAAMENPAPAQANPFDVQRDVLEMFQQERSLAAPLGSGRQPVSLSKPAAQRDASVQSNAGVKQSGKLAPSGKPAVQHDEPEPSKPAVQHDEPEPSKPAAQRDASVQSNAGVKQSGKLAPSSKPAAQHDEPEPSKPAVQHDEPRPSGNTSEYVFGNPFDGPLPDIFEHDEDLKRAISEQNKGRPQASFSSNQPVPNGEGQASKRKRRRSKANSQE